MLEAADGIAFPLDEREATQGATEMEVYWGWPVPMPDETTQLARMITNLQEETCPKLCKDCNMNAQCESTCSGWFRCTPVSGGCQMDGKKYCQTGWSGAMGTVVMQ